MRLDIVDILQIVFVFCVAALVVSFFSYTLIGCSHINYTAMPDGSTKAEIWCFATNDSIDGLLFETGPDGRRLKVGNAEIDRTTGIDKINQGLSLIIEGAAKGIK